MERGKNIIFIQSFQLNMFLSDPDISYRLVREYRLDIFLPQQEHCIVYQRLNTQTKHIFAFYIFKEQILILSLIKKVSLCI